MNQKTSKALRKATEFKVHKPRKYKTTNWSTGGHTFEAVEGRGDYQKAKQEYLAKKRGE